MRICILSDCAAPTAHDYPGHGLGQAVSTLAQTLAIRGHDVVLIAAEDSHFPEGELHTPTPIADYRGEQVMAQFGMKLHQKKPFKVFIDNSHSKILSHFLPTHPIVSVYHDRWMRPGAPNPILVSEGLRAFPEMNWAQTAKVIHHVLNPASFPFVETPHYPPFALFCGIVRDYKNPTLAVEASIKADIDLYIIGNQTSPLFGQYSRCKYLGMVNKGQRAFIMGNASVHLQLGDSESFGLTTIEIGLCGTPTVAIPRGGSVDLIQYEDGTKPLNGVFIQMSRNMVQSVADSIYAAISLSREATRKVALQFCDAGSYVLKWEQVLVEVAR